MSGGRWPRILLPAAAIAAAVWSVIPFSVWWDNARPDYFSAAWQVWGWGSAVSGIVVAIALVVTRGRAADIALSWWRHLMSVPSRRFVLVTGLVVAAETVLFSVLVFDGNPRTVDGFAQLFQARVFLAGRLWAQAPPEIANFATLHMIVGPERWFTQYPPGQSLVLASGLALGAWWLLNPLIAVLFVAATHRVARWCADEATARLALLLLCLSPFVLAVAGSELGHLAAAALAMGAAAFAISAVSGERPLRSCALAGLALGAMVAFRPLDAVAAAVPVAVILTLWSPKRIPLLATVAVAGVIGTLPTLWYNGQTTGAWLQFGYVFLWGPELRLGFHSVPWGVPLTLTRAIARSGLDLHQLNMYLLDSTLPALPVVALGFLAGRRGLLSRDVVPFVAAGALMAPLFFYWHRDVFYGPRFLYTVVAWFVILLARALVLLRRAGPGPRGALVGLHATFAVLTAIIVGLIAITPGRVNAYRRGTPIFNLHPDRDARRLGLTHALVVIPDGWGTRLIARMWQLGVPVRRSGRLYAAIDACTLEQALDAAEAQGAARAHLVETLDSLASLKRPGARAGVTADENLRLLPGVPPAACAQEIEVDRRGYYQYAPFLYLNTAALDGGVVWARDLGPGNTALFRRFAGRRLLRYAPVTPNGPPGFLPLSGPGW